MGGAPPPRLAAREHIPLPPTMQPYLHIFSHFAFRGPPARRKRPANGRFPARRARRARTRPTVQARVHALALKRRLQMRAPAPCAARARIRSPTRRPAGRRKERRVAPTAPPRPAVALAAPAARSPARCAVALAALGVALGGCGSAHAAAPTPTRPAPCPPRRRCTRARPCARPARRRRPRSPPARRSPHQADPYLRLLAVAADARARRSSTSSATWRRGWDRTPASSLSSLELRRLAARARCSRACSAARTPAPSRSAAPAPQGAIVLDTSDAPRRARSSTPRPRTRARTRRATAASPTGDRGGVAFGLVERFAVIGSEAACTA